MARSTDALIRRRERTRGLSATAALISATIWLSISCLGAFPFFTLAVVGLMIARGIGRQLWLDRHDNQLRAALTAGDHEAGLALADQAARTRHSPRWRKRTGEPPVGRQRCSTTPECS
ncbi:MAG: hypothetical protein ACI8S6_003798 [Myxococcota bacterium]|jgi:hypothetical protein